jgi:hypothetical protein
MLQEEIESAIHRMDGDRHVIDAKLVRDHPADGRGRAGLSQFVLSRES